MITIDGMEVWCDRVVAEALRRKGRQLDLEGADKERRASEMARVRRELRIWRDRAPSVVGRR